MLRRAACLLAILAAPLPAGAQSRGCIERPVGPDMDVIAVVPIPRGPALRAHPGGPAPRAAVAIPGQPMHGSECIAVSPPPRDILRGEPLPAGGLLRGDDGRSDLLRDPAPTRPPTGWR